MNDQPNPNNVPGTNSTPANTNTPPQPPSTTVPVAPAGSEPYMSDQIKQSHAGLIVGVTATVFILFAGILGVIGYGMLKSRSATNSANSNDTSKSVNTTTPTTANNSACLSADEAAEAGYSNPNFTSNGFVVGATFFFSPDSTSFLPEYANQQNTDLKKYANWAKKYSAKKFTIEIQGTTNSANATDLGLQRATYVRNELVRLGVDVNHIVIKPSNSYTSDNGTSRNVNLKIVSDPSCLQ